VKLINLEMLSNVKSMYSKVIQDELVSAIIEEDCIYSHRYNVKPIWE